MGQMTPGQAGKISMGVQSAGAGFAAGGAIDQAESDKNSLNYESQIAGNNAVIAEYQAGLAKDIGQTQVQTSELHTDQVYGAQRASMAANGVDLGTGSATDVLASTKYMGLRDANTIQDNANRQAWGYQTEATNYRNQESAYKSASDNINPYMAGFSSLLGGASGVAKSWYSMKQQGG